MWNNPSGIDRREFLRATGAGALGLGLAGGMSTVAFTESTPGVPKAKAKSLIAIATEGGFTHIDTFDPKPNAPITSRSFFKPIPTNVPGIEITEVLPLMAKLADKYSIIRSQTAPGGGHGGYTMHCNAIPPVGDPSGFGIRGVASTHPSAKLKYPAVGAVVGFKKREDGSYKGDIPPWVCIPSRVGEATNGFLPLEYQAFWLGDPNNKGFRGPGVVGSAAEEKQIARRRDLLQAVGAKPKEKPEAFKTADALRDAAFRYMTGDAKKAFDISQEKDSLRDRYGRDYYGQSCLLARRMAEYGVPCTSVTFSSVGDACWHMHGPLIRWLKLMGSMLDRAVSALIEDLAERGMLEHTIVVLFSEMGLSPFWEPKPKTYPGEFDGGRNHWNACFSTVVAGGGFKGGKVVGESDEIGAYIKTRPVYPWDLWESVYQLMGIDPNGRLPNPSGCVAYVSAANACGWPRGGILKEIM